MSDRTEQWCPLCDISTDLHDGISPEIEPWECDAAAQKVGLMNSFYGVALLGRPATPVPVASAGDTATNERGER